MKTKLLINPFYCYIISFGLALIIYSWGWSELYPKLTSDVIIFLFSSLLIALLMGMLISKKLVYESVFTDEKNTRVVVLILCSYLIEFVYNGGVPLFLLLKDVDINYRAFGIPTFHVLLHTFTCFYAVYMFHQYISNKDKSSILYTALLLLPHILTVNRGAFILTITACLIVYLFSIKKVLLSRIAILVSSACLFFYGFGYMGNLRSFSGDSTALPRFTGGSETFMDSLIPKEYYWFYLYASSPFASFQYATINSKTHRYDLAAFVAWEMLPDFLSKRIIPPEADYDGANRLDYSIHPTLTVGSIYFEPFIRLGWYGPILIFIYYIFFIYFYINSLSQNSRYFVSAIAVLCVISALNMFENMLNFSGLIVQLVFPFLLEKVDKYKLHFVGFNIYNKKIRFRL